MPIACRLSTASAGLLLCHSIVPALAGERVEAISGQDGLNALLYKGNFYEGEFAGLCYKSSGSKSSEGDASKQHYRLVMALDNGDAAITGFTGAAITTESSKGTTDVLLTLPRGPNKGGSA